MWQRELFTLLRDEIEEVLVALTGRNGLRDLVREPLAKKTRGLALETESNRLWPLLPLLVSGAICNEHERALPAAVTLQFLLAAGDVFDDIEDNDSPDSVCAKYGLAVAVNVASTLIILGERSLVRLRLKGVDNATIINVVDIINSFYTTACAGQHMDLTAETELSESEETYLKISAMKSASQVECACYIGALIAGATQELVDKFADFGCNLGMASQISNDIEGIINGKDIIKGKITLPVIYALNLPDSEIRNELLAVFQKQHSPVSDYEPVKKLLFHTGAVHYASLKTEVYKQKAWDILSDIERMGTNIDRLKLFLV